VTRHGPPGGGPVLDSVPYNALGVNSVLLYGTLPDIVYQVSQQESRRSVCYLEEYIGDDPGPNQYYPILQFRQIRRIDRSCATIINWQINFLILFFK
jgi:hypothetical protein